MPKGDVCQSLGCETRGRRRDGAKLFAVSDPGRRLLRKKGGVAPSRRGEKPAFSEVQWQRIPTDPYGEGSKVRAAAAAGRRAQGTAAPQAGEATASASLPPRVGPAKGELTHPQLPAANFHVALLDYIVKVGGHGQRCLLPPLRSRSPSPPPPPPLPPGPPGCRRSPVPEAPLASRQRQAPRSASPSSAPRSVPRRPRGWVAAAPLRSSAGPSLPLRRRPGRRPRFASHRSARRQLRGCPRPRPGRRAGRRAEQSRDTAPGAAAADPASSAGPALRQSRVAQAGVPAGAARVSSTPWGAEGVSSTTRPRA